MKIRSNLLKPLALTATSLVASVVLCQSLPAQAANLVRNGGFGSGDNGDLSPWQGEGTDLRANKGFDGSVLVAYLEGKGYLEQTLLSPTAVGENYQLSFDLLFFSDAPNLLKATVGNTIVFDQTNILVPTQPLAFTKTFTGNGSDKLRFDFEIGSGSFQLTNVVVDLANNSVPTSVPEPFTILGSIIGGTAALRMRNQLKFSKKSSDKTDL